MSSISQVRSFATVEEVIEDLKPGYPVYCLRPDEIKRQARYFLDTFPGRVMYAVKCNPHLTVLKALYDAGIRHFDTASLAEIALVREHLPQADCYFMHPVKSRASILTAHEVYKVGHFVIDHEKELDKIIDQTGGGNGMVVLVRIVTPVHDAQYQLSDKFGISAEAAPELLRKVHDADFQTGVAFHVGSQCRTPQAFVDGVNTALDVIDAADVPVHYLDVGGGFPALYQDDQPPPLAAYFDAIYAAFDQSRLRRDCVLMCEPGRALVASGCSLLTQIQLRKDNQLYINDGIYQSLSETLLGKMKLPARLVNPARKFADEYQDFTIYGPTCDNLDILPEPFHLPVDAEEGDWIEIGQTGAYSNSAATRFNGFFPETFVSVDAPPLLPQ
ncbi:MAG: type III PLP-dependent enzyme [Gammaproteobacteria bacterium]|nr:type III PLP-dependent enzyme [Gammaproteobacteria bacterium]